MRLRLLPLLWLALGGCSREDSVVSGTIPVPIDTTNLVKARTDTASDCKTNCDAADLSIPVLSADGGWGAVTTYGGTTPAPSTGGACNYGTTMAHYAAIHVSRLPGDQRLVVAGACARRGHGGCRDAHRQGVVSDRCRGACLGHGGRELLQASPKAVLADSLAKFRLTATYRDGSRVEWTLRGRDFAQAGADYTL